MYFDHPEAKYFNIRKITKHQVEDYAIRKNISVETTEKFLTSNLGY